MKFLHNLLTKEKIILKKMLFHYNIDIYVDE